jgi:Phosphotransferase enzyme family
MADDLLDANYALLAHPYEPRILLLQDGPAWTLPRLASWDAREIRAELRERLALDTTVQRSVYFRARADDEEAARITALESHTPGWTLPPSARWIGRAELDTLPLAIPEHRDAIAAALDEAESGEVPAQRPPWALPGWLPVATAWIDQRLSGLGDTLTGPIEQMHAREWSTVLRVPTTRGLLYFKAEAPCAAFEPGLTEQLARLVPDDVPRVLATDLDRAYMLTEHGGTGARDVAIVGRDLETWEAMLPQFATLQQATASHLDLLLASGCPDLRLIRLPALYAALLADTEMLLVGQPGGLTMAEYNAARAFTPEVASLCAALAAFGLPETVHHDDFHLGNMLVRDGRFVFIDWAEGAVTHPLCSLMITLRVAKLLRRSGDDTLARMRDIYLAAWTDFAPLPRLVEAFTRAQRIALLLRALTWRDAVSHMEPNARLQYGDSPAYWLRLFLTAQTWLPNADAAYTS